ncbi:hypothetical protein HAX54_051930 [Datura stramonium]|uniref:Uncharacterized protein n=1 Tax=Datura stramonium TaxID=4076 RepID=A0ABS8SYA1_DATST|nr:hypothetical protein [Datura stramonium]
MASLVLLLEALVRSHEDINLQGTDDGLFFDDAEAGDNNSNTSFVSGNKDYSYYYCGWIFEAEDVPSWKIISHVKPNVIVNKWKLDPSAQLSPQPLAASMKVGSYS